MSPEEITEMLDEMGLKYRYHHFTTREAVDPPFMVWNVPGTDNFFADGVAYHTIRKLDIELYTDTKDWELEKKLEEILTRHGIAWQQTASLWISSESMWESLYEMEV